MLAGPSWQAPYFVLKVHSYLKILVDGNADVWCTVGGRWKWYRHVLPTQGAGCTVELWEIGRVVPTPPLSLFTWKSTEYCFSLHSKETRPFIKIAPWKNVIVVWNHKKIRNSFLHWILQLNHIKNPLKYVVKRNLTLANFYLLFHLWVLFFQIAPFQ